MDINRLGDINTLKKYYEAGLFKHLTDADEKAMQSPDLRQYEDIFRYMLDHNCKVSDGEAMGLLRDVAGVVERGIANDGLPARPPSRGESCLRA